VPDALVKRCGSICRSPHKSGRSHLA
jgi:hypothetical protein